MVDDPDAKAKLNAWLAQAIAPQLPPARIVREAIAYWRYSHDEEAQTKFMRSNDALMLSPGEIGRLMMVRARLEDLSYLARIEERVLALRKGDPDTKAALEVINRAWDKRSAGRDASHELRRIAEFDQRTHATAQARARTAKRSLERQEVHQVWQEMADELRTRHPTWKKASLARAISKMTDAPYSTVRQT